MTTGHAGDAIGPPLVEARQLGHRFRLGGGWFSRPSHVHAVEGVDLKIRSGDNLGIVGESGSGKSTLGRLLLGLFRQETGEVLVDGRPMPPPGSPAWRTFRAKLQVVAQNPVSALNPRLTIGSLVGEPLHIHRRDLGLAAVRERAAATLAAVGLSAAHAERYPHQLSGGQRQRVVIARALIVEPELIVFDEAVSAVDVSVQAQILALIGGLRTRRNLTYLFISHDLRAVRQVCSTVGIMYLGRIVELGPIETIYAAPQHPYTRALLDAVPRIGSRRRKFALRGDPPSPVDRPSGCAFHPRCPMALPLCAKSPPSLAPSFAGGSVACHRAGEGMPMDMVEPQMALPA